MNKKIEAENHEKQISRYYINVLHWVGLRPNKPLRRESNPRQPLITPVWLLLPLVSFSGNDSRHKYFISASSWIFFSYQESGLNSNNYLQTRLRW